MVDPVAPTLAMVRVFSVALSIRDIVRSEKTEFFVPSMIFPAFSVGNDIVSWAVDNKIEHATTGQNSNSLLFIQVIKKMRPQQGT